MRNAVQEGFNLLLLSHRAWHSVERSLFRESIRGKIKLVPSAPSPLASRHKADDYQLEPAQLQRSTGASQPSNQNINCLNFGNFFWQVAGFLFCTSILCNALVLCTPWSIDILRSTTQSEIPCIITFYGTVWMQASVLSTVSRNTMVIMGCIASLCALKADILPFFLLCLHGQALMAKG